MTDSDPEALNEEYNTLLPDDTLNLQEVDVAPLYSRIRSTLIRDFNVAYTLEQLQTPSNHRALIKPILDHLLRVKNGSALFSLLLNRWDFQREAFRHVGQADVWFTRALAAELIAVEYAASFRDNLLRLVSLLTFEFSPYQGVKRYHTSDCEGENQVEECEDEDVDTPFTLQNRIGYSSALSIAVRSEAKQFTSSPLVQLITQKIWSGDIVFYAKQIDSDNYYSLLNKDLSDSQKRALRASVGLHSSLPDRFGGVFRVSRLRVPFYQSILTILFYLALMVIYSAVLMNRSVGINWLEGLLMVLVIGYSIDEVQQMHSHGFYLYFRSIWNFLDIFIYSNFWFYFILRFLAMYYSDQSQQLNELAFDMLSCNAIVMWPRLLMILDGYPFFGMLIITLKHMFMDAALFFMMALLIFFGFYQALNNLSFDNLSNNGRLNVFITMLRIFFGSAYLGFDTLPFFKSIIGKLVMFLYISLTALFLMTILMSIFNESFSSIYKNASKEHLFNLTTKVVEYIENEALFPFIAPFNLVPILVLYPLYPFLSYRRYAFLNRSLIRILFAPFLVFIYLYERFIKEQTIESAPILFTSTLSPFPLSRSISHPAKLTHSSLQCFKINCNHNDHNLSNPLSIPSQYHQRFNQQMQHLLKTSITGAGLPYVPPIEPAQPAQSLSNQVQKLEQRLNQVYEKLDQVLLLLNHSSSE